MLSFPINKSLTVVKPIHWDLHIQSWACPSNPIDLGRERAEAVCLSMDTISSSKDWASATLVRQIMETLLSFQHLTEQSMNLPVSPCPWQSFSSARSWLKSSWWAIQLSCKYHPHEYKATVFRRNTSFTKAGIKKQCFPRSNLITYTGFLVGGTPWSSTGGKYYQQLAIVTQKCRTDKGCVCKLLNNAELLLAPHVPDCMRCFQQ